MVCGSYSTGTTGLTVPFKNGLRRGEVDGIDVIELDLSYSNSDGFIKRTMTFVRFAARSIRIAFSEQYDLVFATSTPLTAGIPGILARWLRWKPFVFEVRDLWPELPREMGVITNPLVLGLMSMLEWASYHSANRLIGLSPGIVNGIARRGIPKDRITLIPNGCDIELFSSPAVAWRPDSVAPTDLMAVFTGTHGPANGLDAVLDAAAELKRRKRADIKLVLVGEGKNKGALMERATREGLENVVFHASVSKTRLAGLLASADLGLQILANVPAFYYGTSPNKFFDYIASGLPVLNNYPGWLADMIREGNCGYAVPAANPAAFADALEAAADDRVELAAKARRARLLSASFDRAVLSGKFADWLEQASAAEIVVGGPSVDG
jgi:glycosyltransferase involved in cell wall biosynthesis